ncbi:bifunctional riboflavin kinase/FAD synthetase [Cyanobacterium sp. IPPAS B-1200]|uniref:bifunctional riboflavin kinase/FAD synthetase n=1 Tax=Cyanobacterium sp. IPPAS B-1200 TaxID=1562720 RepID=UPI0008525E0C|nr:bifunctional riboflavin kinase/FAD synthetase [Cyanobacterium sp. IPPAS B-1200]OEJ80146.1 bifunctional riboflavin kinase/FMN adenylyltransferase [Cyanobacterium sp. IPPAS B-1200]
MLVTSSLENIITPNAIALGNFDGLHRGHQRVINSIFKINNPDIYPTLVTFTPHPQEYFTGKKKQLLTPIPEKAKLLEKMGVKQLILLPFDRELATLSARAFVKDILVEKINAKYISIGSDFRFGYQRQGDAHKLQELTAENNIYVNITAEEKIDVNDSFTRISSSDIRRALGEGNLSLAEGMLGRKYTLKGKVIKGKQLGRTIGFPTANLDIDKQKFLPKKGVYKVIVHQNNIYDNQLLGVMNIGDRPTVDGTKTTVEVHILNWEGDLYNKVLEVELLKFLRPEKKFNSLDELKEQITMDCQVALEY